MQTTDLVLAMLHHLLAFSLPAVIATEFMLVRGEQTPASVRQLARIDRHYGFMAAAVILVGIGRVVYGLKGWEFYVYNWVFWAKMAAFLAVGLISIRPSMRYVAWNSRIAADPAYRVPAPELAAVRAQVLAQALVFALIPLLAAAMARGYGA